MDFAYIKSRRVKGFGGETVLRKNSLTRRKKFFIVHVYVNASARKGYPLTENSNSVKGGGLLRRSKKERK